MVLLVPAQAQLALLTQLVVVLLAQAQLAQAQLALLLLLLVVRLAQAQLAEAHLLLLLLLVPMVLAVMVLAEGELALLAEGELALLALLALLQLVLLPVLPKLPQGEAQAMALLCMWAGCGRRSSVCTSSIRQSSPAACRCRNAHWFASTRFARSWYTWCARTMRTRRIGISQPAPKTHHRPAWLTMSCTSETHCLNKLLDPLLLLPHYMPILPLRRMRNAARNAACRRECGIPQAQAYTCLSLTQSHYLNFNISPDHLKQRKYHDVTTAK